MAEITVLCVIFLFIAFLLGWAAITVVEFLIRISFIIGIISMIRCIIMGIVSENSKRIFVLDIIKTIMVCFFLFCFSHWYDSYNFEILIFMIIIGDIICICGRGIENPENALTVYVVGCLVVIFAVCICAAGCQKDIVEVLSGNCVGEWILNLFRNIHNIYTSIITFVTNSKIYSILNNL